MPACLTHHEFARNVLNDRKRQEPIHETAFYWGAQGPDFLFCHRYFPWMKGRSLSAYGYQIHTDVRPSVTFSAMREYLKDHSDPAYRSYVEGFLCHYSLDSIAHPYINALAARLLEERPYETMTTMHGEIEAALDAIVLRRETGKLPSEVSLGSMFPKNETVQRRIARLYRAVILNDFGEDIPEEELFQATADAHFTFSLLTDRTGMKKKLFDAIEKGKPSAISSHLVPITENDSIDYANILQEEWADGDSRDFFRLFDDARKLAGELIDRFDDCDFSELTGERPFG